MPDACKSSPCLMDVINALDEANATVTRLAELGAVIDGNESYFPHLIEVLAIIAQQSAHIDKLLSQLATAVLPRPRAVGDHDG
jgi:hypothetical protein